MTFECKQIGFVSSDQIICFRRLYNRQQEIVIGVW